MTSLPAQASVPAPPNTYLAINEYATASNASAFDIITGPDGNIWYTIPAQDEVVKASPVDGSVLGTVFLGDGTPSCAPTGIAIGPDRNIWTACFAAQYGSTHAGLLVRIIPSTLAQRGMCCPAPLRLSQPGASARNS